MHVNGIENHRDRLTDVLVSEHGFITFTVSYRTRAAKYPQSRQLRAEAHAAEGSLNRTHSRARARARAFSRRYTLVAIYALAIARLTIARPPSTRGDVINGDGNGGGNGDADDDGDNDDDGDGDCSTRASRDNNEHGISNWFAPTLPVVSRRAFVAVRNEFAPLAAH